MSWRRRRRRGRDKRYKGRSIWLIEDKRILMIRRSWIRSQRKKWLIIEEKLISLLMIDKERSRMNKLDSLLLITNLNLNKELILLKLKDKLRLTWLTIETRKRFSRVN